MSLEWIITRPPTKLREGNVFSRVCLSVVSINMSINYRLKTKLFLQASVILFTIGEGSTPLYAGIHSPPPPTRGSHTSGTPPVQCMLGYGQQADGTHPTGMQSCYRLLGEGNVFTGVCLSTIGLMVTRSLLGLVTAWSVCILLECFLVTRMLDNINITQGQCKLKKVSPVGVRNEWNEQIYIEPNRIDTICMQSVKVKVCLHVTDFSPFNSLFHCPFFY